MKYINAAPDILFRFQNSKIMTNTKDSPEAMRHVSDLRFSIINISGKDIKMDGGKGACVALTFHCGQGSESLFQLNAPDSHYGIIYGPDGFKPSVLCRNPVKKSQLKLRLDVKSQTVITLPSMGTISFHWSGIITCAKEGFSSVSLSFSGIEGLSAATLTHSLYKQCTYADIISFYAAPSAGAPGAEVTLNWKIENADTGALLPVGYDIMQGGSCPASAVNVKLDQNRHYYLNINSSYRNVYQDLYLTIYPPVIAAVKLLPADRIEWEVHFASRTELICGSKVIKVPNIGNSGYDEKLTAVALCCHGLYQLEHRIHIPPVPEIHLFTLDIITYSNHQCLVLQWETKGLRSLALTISDIRIFELPNQKCGRWEQIYDLGLNVAAELAYEAAGQRGTLSLDNEKYCEENYVSNN